MTCHESTLVHTVSYVEFDNWFRKQKPIKIVRKKRTQLTFRVTEITMEMRYTDVLWRNIRNALGQNERHFHITWSAAQVACGVIKDIIASQAIESLVWSRHGVRVFSLKCRVSNPSSLIDLSVPHSQTMKHTIYCAYCYIFYIKVSNWMRMPETAEQ